MKRDAITFVLIAVASLARAGELNAPPVTPAVFIAEHSQLHEVATNPEMNWTFRTNSSFSATSASSTYGFMITGRWDVVSGGQVHILGTSTNTRTQVVRYIENTITNIQVWRLSKSDPPQVILKKVIDIDAFERQPTPDGIRQPADGLPKPAP